MTEDSTLYTLAEKQGVYQAEVDSAQDYYLQKLNIRTAPLIGTRSKTMDLPSSPGRGIFFTVIVVIVIGSFLTWLFIPQPAPPPPKPQPKTDFWGNQMPPDGTVSAPSVPSGSVPSSSLTKLGPNEFLAAVRDLKVGQVLPEQIRISCLLYIAGEDGTTYYYPETVEDGTMNIRVDPNNKILWIKLAKPDDKE